MRQQLKIHTTPPVKKTYDYVPANLDPSIQIRADQVQFVHVEQVKHVILPNAPLHPIETRWVKVWRVKNWKWFESLMGGMIDPVKAAGLTSVRVVHDPTITETNDYREKKKAEMKKGGA